jgi:hypothetical protein
MLFGPPATLAYMDAIGCARCPWPVYAGCAGAGGVDRKQADRRISALRYARHHEASRKRVRVGGIEAS